jgi:HSP20 family molecular chaperone IbpA
MSVLTAKRNVVPTLTTPLFEQGTMFNPSAMYTSTHQFNPSQMYSASPVFSTTPFTTPTHVAPSTMMATQPGTQWGTRMSWNPAMGWDNTTSTPACNVFETASEFICEIAVPGVRKEEICIELDGNILTARTEKFVPVNTFGFTKHREFSYGSFCRSIELPFNVSVERIKAVVENGVLFISIPKSGFISRGF